MDIRIGSEDEKNLAYALCAGMEGGIDYWARIVRYTTPTAPRRFLFDDQTIRYVDYPMSEGGAVQLAITEGGEVNGERVFTLTRAKLEAGLALMARKYPRHFANWVRDTGDADTGDVLVQLALFGDIVFG